MTLRAIRGADVPATPDKSAAKSIAPMIASYSPKREHVLLFALLALGTALSFACLGRGWINPEAEGFIPHYLSHRSLPALVFDPVHTDWNNFQGRELSYVFDWLDCRFILLCTKAGLPHFLSITHLGLVAAMAVWLFVFARRSCELPPDVALALVAVWLTSPAAVLGANFYRSAKIACAAATLVMLAAAWRYRQGRGGLILIPIAAATAALCDRQGFALVAFFGVWLGLRAVVWRDHAARHLALAAAAAFAVAQVYTVVVGPALIAHYAGSPPIRDFMHPAWIGWLSASGLKTILVYAPLNALQTLGFQLGNLPPLLVAVVFVVAALRLPLPREVSVPPRLRSREALWWLCVPAAFVLLNMGMALRQPNVVVLAEFKRIYFPLPAMAWLFALTAVATRFAIVRGWIRAPLAAGCLVLLALSNLVSLPGHRLLYANGGYSAEIAAAPRHLRALRSDSREEDRNPAILALRANAWPDHPPSSRSTQRPSP